MRQLSYQRAFKNRLNKVGEFLCSHFNIEDGRKTTFLALLCFIISRKVKTQLKHNKKICAVYGEGAVTDRTCQKWFAKSRAGDFLLDEAAWLG